MSDVWYCINESDTGDWVTSIWDGLGIPADQIPSTGESGAAYLFNDIAGQGASPTDEFSSTILTVPPVGVFTHDEYSALSFTGAADGVYTATYMAERNSVPYLNPETAGGEWVITMTIGLSNYQLDSDGGAFSYSGGAATLTYSSAPSAYELTAEGGVFSYSGGNAQLTFGNTLSAEGGGFTYAGGDAAFSRTYLLQASGGSFSFSGGAASLNYSAAVYSRISGYTIGYAQSPVSAEYRNNQVGI